MIEEQRSSPQRPSKMRVRIYHNSLWARYKGAVYSQLYRLSQNSPIEPLFVQIAETDVERVELGGVDLSYHQYPFCVLFRGAYGDVSTIRRIVGLTRDLLANPSELVVLSGYDRIENWAMLFVCMLLRRKRAVACDSTMFDQPRVGWKSWAKHFFFSRCIGVIGYGQRSKEYLLSLGVREADIIIPCQAAALPHDYDSSAILLRYSQHTAETYLPPRFLFVGRLATVKGLGDLMQAFSLVRAGIPAARLDVIGAGPLKAELLNLVSELGLADAVSLHGPKDLGEIVPQFFRSVALVLPSHSEPWGLVVNEALSFGCPVVVSDRCGCVPELVIRDVTGFTFKSGDVEALSEAMLAVLRLSDNRPDCAKRCLRVMAKFTAERAAARMLEGYTQFLGVRDSN